MTPEACGKIILFGEHAVVVGGDALAMSLDRGVTINVRPHDQLQLDIPAWQTTVTARTQSALGHALRALSETCSVTSPQRLEARLQIPAGAGLGCSAALGTAVARALLGKQGEPQSVFRATQAWERVFHGTPSGIDAWAAQGLGAFLFARGGTPRTITSRRTLHFAIAHSGQAGSTKEMVERVAKQLETNASARTHIQRVSEIVARGTSAFERGSARELGALLDENHAVLQALGVSTSALDTLCTTFRAHGALGAKLTGSGGGGCAIAVFASQQESAAAVEALRPHHAPCFALTSTTEKGTGHE